MLIHIGLAPIFTIREFPYGDSINRKSETQKPMMLKGWIDACMYVCHAWMEVFMLTWMNACMYAIHGWKCSCLHVCMYVCM